jgi:hypothetical protein
VVRLGSGSVAKGLYNACMVEEGWGNRKAERHSSLGVLTNLNLEPRDWRSRRQCPHRSQEFLIAWELVQADHAFLGTLDVDPSDDATPIDQELSAEPGGMVPSPLLPSISTPSNLCG